MSTIKPFLTTTGATLALGIIGAVPAQAALFDFNFSTINGATGSFTLNTSIPDSNPVDGAGLFQNAITNVQYPLYGINLPEPRDLTTSINGDVVIFSLFQRPSTSGVLDVYLDYDDPDQLSDNPADYFISTSGSFAGYGGFIQSPGTGQGQAPFSRIIGLTVTRQDKPQSIPEPGTILGLSFLGMWSLKKLARRQRT